MDNRLWAGYKAGKTIIPTHQYVKQVSLLQCSNFLEYKLLHKIIQSIHCLIWYTVMT